MLLDTGHETGSVVFGWQAKKFSGDLKYYYFPTAVSPLNNKSQELSFLPLSSSSFPVLSTKMRPASCGQSEQGKRWGALYQMSWHRSPGRAGVLWGRKAPYGGLNDNVPHRLQLSEHLVSWWRCLEHFQCGLAGRTMSLDVGFVSSQPCSILSLSLSVSCACLKT